MGESRLGSVRTETFDGLTIYCEGDRDITSPHDAVAWAFTYAHLVTYVAERLRKSLK